MEIDAARIHGQPTIRLPVEQGPRSEIVPIKPAAGQQGQAVLPVGQADQQKLPTAQKGCEP